MNPRIVLARYFQCKDFTLGALFIDEFRCYTLERGNGGNYVCIPSGNYHLKARDYGTHYKHFTKKYDWHHETIEISGVPDRTDILIHPFNWWEESEGCIGTGMVSHIIKGKIDDSLIAYKMNYPDLLSAAKASGAIEIIEFFNVGRREE